MMNVECAMPADFDAWIMLAREVEHLFGPMADEESFQNALRSAIAERNALCIRSDTGEKGRTLRGGIVISPKSNEIVWLTVSERCRRQGAGRALLTCAIGRLQQREDIFVQTFDESVAAGAAARALYKNYGFNDCRSGDVNPAGVPTVIMRRPGSDLIDIRRNRCGCRIRKRDGE